MRNELDVVRLRRSIEGVPAGTQGTIVVMSSEVTDKYLVEFPGPDLTEPKLVSVHEDDLEASV